MVTPLAFHTTMPSRGVKSCSAAADGHGCAAVPLLPSMITRLRSSPRMCRSGLSIQTPAVGHCVLFS